jgi:hypothetical protein
MNFMAFPAWGPSQLAVMEQLTSYQDGAFSFLKLCVPCTFRDGVMIETSGGAYASKFTSPSTGMEPYFQRFLAVAKIGNEPVAKAGSTVFAFTPYDSGGA